MNMENRNIQVLDHNVDKDQNNSHKIDIKYKWERLLKYLDYDTTIGVEYAYLRLQQGSSK